MTSPLLYGLLLQVTLACGAALAALALLRRASPAVRADVAGWSLAAVLMLTCVAAVPFFRWPAAFEPHAAANRVEAQKDAELLAEQSTAPTDDGASGELAADDAYSLADWWLQPVLAADSAVRWLQAAAVEPVAASRTGRWSAIAIAVLCVAAVLRIAVAAASICSLRRQSQPVNDAALDEQSDVFLARLGCRQPVEIREAEVSSAAVVGWRRPLVLLPPDWRTWSPTQQRCVLAHELAHVARADFRAGLLGKLAAAFHCYHPLAWLLERRLRLEQELAADETAAALVGGRRIYLSALAELALRRDDRPPLTLARPFFPRRESFLRRIEMLRRNPDAPAASPERRPWRTGLAVAACALLIAAVRPGPLAETAKAQAAAASENYERFDLRYVARDALGAIGLRPAELLAEPSVATLLDAFGGELETQAKAVWGISPREIEEALIVVDDVRSLQGKGSPTVVIRAAEPHDWAAQLKKTGALPGDLSFQVLDDRTVAVGSAAAVARAQVMHKLKTARPEWEGLWREHADAAVIAAINVAAVRPLIQQAPEQVRFGLAGFSPLIDRSDYVVDALHLGESARWDVVAQTRNEEDARQVAATATALLVLGRNFLSQAYVLDSVPPEMQMPIQLAAVLLEQATIETDDQHRVAFAVELDSETAGMTTTVAAMLLPAIQASREAARRTQGMNNLKQLALAMHMYHDQHKAFPPSVLYSDNGTPYSWRVAILPYLEQQALYDAYRFDEPWDSENNRRIGETIIRVYKSPNSRDFTSVTNYLLVGWPKGDGWKMSEIRDGTSNTIMIVETASDVPWTKPEDLPYDGGDDLPTLGGLHEGGFNAAMCDGSVRFIAESIDAKMLRLLLLPNDGERVDIHNQR